MTLIILRKNNAVILEFMYTLMVMAVAALFPYWWIVLFIPLCSAGLLASELSLCGRPEESESSDEGAGEPGAKVAAVTPLESKVGKDADEASDDDEKERHHDRKRLRKRNSVGCGNQ